MPESNLSTGLYGNGSLRNMHLDWLEYSWIRRAVNSYANRMRVDNFTPSGNVMFTEILRKAILDIPVFFIMQKNGRASSTKETRIPTVANTQVSSQESAQQDQQYVVRKEIISGFDPVDVDSIVDYDVEPVSYVDYNGLCYDADGLEIEGLYCVQLFAPPITRQAVDLAIGAKAFDDATMSAMRNITVPTPYISGTDSDAQIGQKQAEDSKRYSSSAGGESKNSKLDDAIILPHSNLRNAGSAIKADIGILGQWDTQKMFAYQQSKAVEFVGETSVPPVDFPETNALGQTAQALVSNREPFVSRVASIKEQFNAVFDTAGIPELSWQLLFPYTPQDIASIGDAAGKGVDAGSLRGYGDTLA